MHNDKSVLSVMHAVVNVALNSLQELMTALVGMLWLLLIARLLSLSSSELYHIVPVSDTASCQDYPEHTCFTLEKFQHRFKDGIIFRENTIAFMSGYHTLTWRMHFKGTGNVTLKNSEQVGTNSTPVITCNANAGIEVDITDNFTIQGLVFTAKEEVVHEDTLLYVRNAAHTTLTQSSFVNIHSNMTVVSIHSTTQIISNCWFIYNSGQDAVLEIGNTYSCNIEKSVFRGNKGGEIGGAIYAFTRNVMKITESMFVNNSRSGAGGAINIELGGGSFHSIKNKFEANSCNSEGGAIFFFMDSSGNATFQGDLFLNNIAQEGAALYITGFSKTDSYSSIINCTFSNNNATDPDYPSVVYNEGLKLTLTGPVTFEENFGSLYVSNSDAIVNGNFVFRNNIGVNGGAITLKNSNLKFDSDYPISTKVNITDNKASYGAGIYLEQSSIKSSWLILTIANNTAKIGGGIYAFESQISFKSITYVNIIHVANNLAKVGGGLYMITGSNLQLSFTYLRVSNNTAYYYGGGAYLERDSHILLINKHWRTFILLDFTGNSAVKGGGIFVADSINSKLTCDRIASPSQTENIPHTTQCFIQATYDDRPHKKLIFNNNSATEAGSDIYGGLLDRCTVSGQQECVNSNIGYGLKHLQAICGFGWTENKKVLKFHSISVIYGNVIDKTEFHNHISSDPMRVCFCVNGNVDCDYTHPTVFTKKGHEFIFNLAAVDQVEKPVNATLISSLLFQNQGEGRLNQGQQLRKLPQHCTELKYNAFSSTSQAVLELYAVGPCGNKGISKQLVNITFEPCDCPIGLERYSPYIDCVCGCNKELEENIKISNCSVLNSTIQLNENIWIKYGIDTNNTAQFIIHPCPFDYCKKKPLNVSLANETETNKQCAFNRTGTFCGKCKQGLSMVLASSQCQTCSNYYLFLLLPFGLAGIALVAFILLLNITVATGTIHGLIFYANIITANRSIFLQFGKPNVLTVFLSWLNFDLGIKTCFYNGMDSYGKLMLQLVFPAYVFFLIATIMVLCDRSQTIARLFGKRNPEATLYTLFLLSYSKLIRTIVTALQFATLDYPDGSREIVWLYDANVRYFTINHIPRFLAAFIITILGAVYTMLLLFGQLFNRCSEYPLMKWTSQKYYIHFMKAHHAPLSDKHRYWVGLLLLARLAYYLISAFANGFTIVLSASIMTLLLLVHQIVVKPYAKMLGNFLDAFFLINLLVLAIGTLYVQVSGGNQQALAIVSMSISFTAFLGIIFYHILDSCGVKTKILSKFRKRRDIDYHPVAIFELDNENTSEESDEELIDLANAPEDTATIELYDPSRYITPPIIRSVLPDDQLREPALDDICPLTPADYNLQPATPRIRQIRQAPTVTEVIVTK